MELNPPPPSVSRPGKLNFISKGGGLTKGSRPYSKFVLLHEVGFGGYKGGGSYFVQSELRGYKGGGVRTSCTWKIFVLQKCGNDPQFFLGALRAPILPQYIVNFGRFPVKYVQYPQKIFSARFARRNFQSSYCTKLGLGGYKGGGSYFVQSKLRVYKEGGSYFVHHGFP